MDIRSRSRYERRVCHLVESNHRGSATEGEAQAAAYLSKEMRGMGLEPVLEPFAGSRSLGVRLLLHVFVAAIGAGTLWHRPILAIVLSLIALGSLVLEMTTKGKLLSRLLRRHPSANLSARVAPRQGEVRLRLIICGHHDSQRSGFIWNEAIWRRLPWLLRRLPPLAQSPFFVVALTMLMQPFVGLVAIAGVAPTIVSTSGALILIIYAVTGIILADWSVGKPVPGASDNASGAAAVLTLGEVWLAEPVDGVEVVLLSTGCEETGLLGAAAWANEHRAEIRAIPTSFLNLDGLGFGSPRFLGFEIPLVGLPKRYPAQILAACRQLAAEHNLVAAGPCSVAGFTDGLAFLVRGISGVTIVGTQDDGQLPHWHRRTDDIQRMDFDAAWRGVNFAAWLMVRLAKLS